MCFVWFRFDLKVICWGCLICIDFTRFPSYGRCQRVGSCDTVVRSLRGHGTQLFIVVVTHFNQSRVCSSRKFARGLSPAMRSGLAASRGLRSCVPPRALLGVAPRSRWPAGIAASSRGVAKPLACSRVLQKCAHIHASFASFGNVWHMAHHPARTARVCWPARQLVRAGPHARAQEGVRGRVRRPGQGSLVRMW